VGTARLLHFTIVVPDGDERDRITEAVGGELRDPSGNAFELVT
jgi:hypothetical protein